MKFKAVRKYLILSCHHCWHSPTILIEGEVIPENHRLELLVEVRVLPGDILELLEGVLEGWRAAQLLEVFRGVVQHSVVGSKKNFEFTIFHQLIMRPHSTLLNMLYVYEWEVMFNCIWKTQKESNSVLTYPVAKIFILSTSICNCSRQQNFYECIKIINNLGKMLM